jgi:hypothetical protein
MVRKPWRRALSSGKSLPRGEVPLFKLLGNPGAGLCLVAEASLQITQKNAGDFLSSILVQLHPKVHKRGH